MLYQMSQQHGRVFHLTSGCFLLQCCDRAPAAAADTEYIMSPGYSSACIVEAALTRERVHLHHHRLQMDGKMQKTPALSRALLGTTVQHCD